MTDDEKQRSLPVEYSKFAPSSAPRWNYCPGTARDQRIDAALAYKQVRRIAETWEAYFVYARSIGCSLIHDELECTAEQAALLEQWWREQNKLLDQWRQEHTQPGGSIDERKTD